MEGGTKNGTLFDREDLEYDHFDYELQQGLQYIITSGVVFISLLSDMILMFLILKTNRLRFKSHAVLFNWALWDFIFLLGIRTFFGILFDVTYLVYGNGFLVCAVEELNSYSHLMCCVLLLIYSSNTIMNSEKVSTKLLICTLYSLFLLLVLIFSFLCNFYISYEIELMLFITITMIIVVIFKDINRCCKLTEGGINPESNFRLNIIKIYTYSWCAALAIETFAKLLHIPSLSIVFLFVLFCPVVILIYILNVDKEYKACFLNLIKCNFRHNEVVTRTNFHQENVNSSTVSINSV